MNSLLTYGNLSKIFEDGIDILQIKRETKFSMVMVERERERGRKQRVWMVRKKVRVGEGVRCRVSIHSISKHKTPLMKDLVSQLIW